MKKLTTLSLITATIIGLTGCGETTSTSKASEGKIELSSISKLSEASTKHKTSDWLEIQGLIQDLDNTEGFNTMLLASIETNADQLKSVGMDKEEAYASNANELYEKLINLELDELDNQVVAECKEDETCKEEAYGSIAINLTIDKEEAYEMSVIYRGDDNALVNDKLIDTFKCEAGEVRTVQHYGLEDVFSTNNGVEPTTQRPAAINQNMLDYNSNVNAGFANYDDIHNNRLFLDNIDNLPTGITSGRFYIGLKSNGSSLQVNDTISIGDLTATGALNTQARFSAKLTDLNNTTLNWSNQLVSNTNPTTDIYWNDFSNITFYNGQTTLLDHVQTNNHFDAYVQDDTSVDFITVATCSKPDPIKEVGGIINKFECSEQETLVKILGGTLDNFTAPVDPTTPRADLITKRDANTVYPGVNVPYDYTSYDHHFIDTLNLGLTAGQTISKAQFNIGYKVIGSSLASNDAIYLGDFETNHAGGHLYDTTSPIIPQGWNVTDINSYGHVANVDLLALQNNITNATGTVGTTMITNGYLDVYVQDDTAVDFTQLNLCVKDGCDENAKDIKLDLSQLASWTNQPSDSQENSLNNPSAWASDMNWIRFDNNGTDRVLEIPFCACGDTIANITHLKGDNRANVELNGIFVTQPGNTGGITAFSADSAGGNHVDGTKNIAGTGIGINHVLKLNVHNFTSSQGNDTPFGVAVEGTLTFKGNLGKCQ